MQRVVASLAAIGLILVAPADVTAQDTSHAETRTEGFALEDFQPTLGGWQVTNWLMTGPGQFEERYFTINVAADLGGKGLRTDWYSLDGAYFGTVLQTLRRDGQGLDQLYFAAAQDSWTVSEQHPERQNNGFGTRFNGEDEFGRFEARSQTRYLPDGGGFDWTIERRYPGTGWFVIDRGEARPTGD